MTNPEDEEQGRGFKVQDRRRFTTTGDARDEDSPPTASVAAEPEVAPLPDPPEPQPSAAPSEPGPEINFTSFVISLATQAFASLGEIPLPAGGGGAAVDLVGAKELIDILALLQTKTRGNLDVAEAGLLEGVLYDLRLKYVEKVRALSTRS